MISAIIVLLVAFLSTWLTWETYNLHAQNTIQKLETESSRVDRTFIVALDNASYILESIARQISKTGGDDLSRIARLLNSFDTNQKVYSLFAWITPHDELVVSSNQGVRDEPVSVADRDYVKAAHAMPWRVHTGIPIQGRASGRWVLPVGLGVTNDEGKYLGTVMISVDIHGLTAEIADVIRQKGVSFAILGQNKVILTEMSEKQEYLKQNFSQEVLDRLASSGESKGAISRSDIFGEQEMYAFYESSSKYPYTIVISYDAKLSQSEMRSILIPRLVQLFIMAAFLIAVLWVIKLRIITPVMRLSKAAEGIARGRDDVSIPEGGPEEIATLAAQVNRIYQYLQERRRIEELTRAKTEELRQAKEAAELASRTKSEFLTFMSHELRNPLNAVIGFAEVMKNRVYGAIKPVRYEEYAQDIFESGNQMLEIMNDILDIASLEAGHVMLHDRPVNVPEQVKKCIRLLQERAEQAGVTVQYEPEPRLPRLMADDLRLRQILLNLLSNAIEFNRDGGRVTITTALHQEPRGRGMVLKVSDTGKGIPKDQIPLVLSRFGQMAPEFARNYQGNGLGLPLTQELVKLHGGTLEIESEPDKGTTVTVTFPPNRVLS